MKKKAAAALALGAIACLIVLFLPLPQGSYDDGGTREYRALMYKIVVWNKLMTVAGEHGGTELTTYHKVSVFWLPNHRLEIDELWKLETDKNV